MGKERLGELEIEIKEMRYEQLDFTALSALEEQCFQDAWGERLLKSIFEADSHFFAALHKNELIGYGALIKAVDSCDIVSVAVLPNFRGRGIGKKLTLSLLDAAREGNLSEVFLEVRVSNAVAIALYEDLGFEKIDIRKNYYDDGEDAYVMLKQFK